MENDSLDAIRFRLLQLVISRLFEIPLKTIEQETEVCNIQTQKALWEHEETLYLIKYLPTNTFGAFRQGKGKGFGFRFIPYDSSGFRLRYASIESFGINGNSDYVVLNKDGVTSLGELSSVCDYIHSKYQIIPRVDIP